MSNWPERWEKTLIKMAAERSSAADIAAVLGTTRNAVIGKAHRMKITLNGKPGTIHRPTGWRAGDGSYKAWPPR